MPARWIVCSRCSLRFHSEADGSPPCPACADGGGVAVAVGYHLVRDKKKIGPFSFDQLKTMASDGSLKPTDMVLEEGKRTWMPADAVPGLFDVSVPSNNPTLDDSARTGTFLGSADRTGGGVSGLRSTIFPSGDRVPSAVAVPSIPGYEILSELGRGGMGVVYKARHVTLKRLDAIKMILGGGHASASEMGRFLAEAQAVARLQHPNIVQVHEIGEKDGLPFFSLEYVNGGTLAKRLGGTPLSPREAAQFSTTLAVAIEAAHQAGIVHRDLKPANVLLAGEASTPLLQCVPKVADFGLAKTIGEDSGHTRTGAIMGTPSYMSPEQALGLVHDIGPRSDVYALGAILYEMMTGRPPFKAATVLETIEQVRSQEPVPPSSLQPNLPRDLETICLKCLSKDPARRYASARELADDLNRHLSNQPILARPASLRERTVKFVLRNRLMVGAASAVFLSLLFGIVLSSIQAARARQGQRDAIDASKIADKRLVDLHLETARSLVKRGGQKRALELYQTALDEGHPEKLAIRLEMAYAYAATYRYDDTRRILDELLDDPELGEHRGSVLLLKGYTTMGAQVKLGMGLIRDSIEAGLSPAEKHFAQGLLEETSPKAVEHFRAALKEDPFHHPSHTMYGILLMLLGRTDEAREAAAAARAIFPDDPNMKILAALIAAMKGNVKQAREILAGAKSMISEKQHNALSTGLEILHWLQRLDEPPNFAEQAKIVLLWAQLVKDIDSVWPSAGRKVSSAPEVGASQLLQTPPVLNQSLSELILVMADISRSVGGAGTRETLDRLEKTLEKHPEGLLLYLHGFLLHKQGDVVRARKSLLQAVKTPAIGNIKRSALALILVCDNVLIEKCQNSDDALRRETKLHLDEFLGMGPPKREEYYICCHVALQVGDFHLASKYAFLADVLKTTDPSDAMIMRVGSEFMLKNYVVVVELTDRLLKINPNDAMARDFRDKSIKLLEIALKKANGK